MNTINEQSLPVIPEFEEVVPRHPSFPTETRLDPDNPSWGLWSALLVWISSVVLLLLMQLIAVTPYAIFRYKGSGIDAQSLLTDKTAVFLSIVSVIPAHLLTIAVIWAIVTKFGQRPFWSALGWEWGRRVGIWTSAVVAVVLLGVGLAIVKLFGGQETQLDQIIASSTAARWTTAILASTTAPLVEEIVYRGVIYSALRRAIGSPWAVTGVLLLFTLVHVPQYLPNYGVILTIGILSISLTLMRAITGRLLPSFAIHMVFNGIQSVLIVLEPYVQKVVPTVPPTAPSVLFAVAHTLYRFH